jgi:transposase
MDVLNETLITLCWELYEKGIAKSHIAGRLGKHRETIHIWIKGIQEYGLLTLFRQMEDRNLRPSLWTTSIASVKGIG